MLRLPLIRVKRMPDKKIENKILYIKIDPDIKMTSAILAKEIVYARWLYNPINLISSLFTNNKAKRLILSHETKVQLLHLFYRIKEKDARTAEAWSLLKTHKKMFGKKSLAWIREEMVLVRNSQRKWAIKNYMLIKKHRKNIERIRNS